MGAVSFSRNATRKVPRRYKSDVLVSAFETLMRRSTISSNRSPRQREIRSGKISRDERSRSMTCYSNWSRFRFSSRRASRPEYDDLKSSRSIPSLLKTSKRPAVRIRSTSSSSSLSPPSVVRRSRRRSRYLRSRGSECKCVEPKSL